MFVVDMPPTLAPGRTTAGYQLFRLRSPHVAVGGRGTLDSLFKQAAGEGISAFVSSDDSAAAGCVTASRCRFLRTMSQPQCRLCLKVRHLRRWYRIADTAEPHQYWSSTNGNGLASVLTYIPRRLERADELETQLQVAGTRRCQPAHRNAILAGRHWRSSSCSGRTLHTRCCLQRVPHDAYFGCWLRGFSG